MSLAKNYGSTIAVDIKPSNSLLSFAFWTLFIFCFLISGLISYLDLTNVYKLGYLPIILVFIFPIIHRARSTSNLFASVFVVLIITASSAINQTYLLDVAMYMRYPIFLFLLSWLVDLYLKKDNSHHLLRYIAFISLIQLPVVILQRIFSRQIADTSSSYIAYYDVAFGTFNFSTDYAMSFFLLCVVVSLLNIKNVSKLMPYSRYVFIASVAAIMISGSEMIKIMLIISIILSLIKRSVFIFVLILTTTIFLAYLAIYSFAPNFFLGIGAQNYNTGTSAGYVLNEISSLFDSQASGNIYQIKGFSRHAVIKYALNEPLSWLGSGPHSIYNPLSKERLLPTTDTFVTIYFELGILGLASIFILSFNVFFKPFSEKYSFSSYQIVAFLGFVALGFTAPILSDVSIQITIFIFLKIYTLLKNNDRENNA